MLVSAIAAAPRSGQLAPWTVLIADVTGPTQLGERLDPEAVRRVMERYFELAERVITRHGGTVERFISDAVMAVFGVPLGHEDDALPAVRGRPASRASAAQCRAEAGTTTRALSLGPGSTR
jgi:class 3 adenylate cyclase